MKIKLTKLTFVLALIFQLSSIHADSERFQWDTGHGDILIVGGTEDKLLTIQSVNNYDFDDLTVILNNNAKLDIPDNDSFRFLGEVGDPIWIIPQFNNGLTTFMGTVTDIPSGIFADNKVDLVFSKITGAGDAFVWSTGSSDGVNLLVNTKDGLTREDDAMPTLTPGHAHHNWGFTRPGTYELELKASGMNTSDNQEQTSEPVTLLFEINVLKAGEVDIEVEFEDGNFELLVIDEASESEFGPEDVAFQAVPESWTPIPVNEQFGFLGHAGDLVSILPQVEEEGILFLGLATDELTEGTFEDDSVTLSLDNVSGPGDFFLYTVDSFSNPLVIFNSTEDGPKTMNLGIGLHSHMNWAFTEPGHYELQFSLASKLQDSGADIQSESITLLFEILPPVQRTILTTGEVDIEVEFEDDNFELLILDEGTESEFGPDQVTFQAVSDAWTTVPVDEQFEFLGHAGEAVSILPQVEEEGIIFLGLATDELTEGTFVDNSVTLTLENSHGPGNFFLYTVDTFSTPSVLFDSRVDGPSSTALGVGLHSHMNWAFTEPGHYELQFKISATLQDGGAAVESETLSLIFDIQPPRTILSAGEVDIEFEFEDDHFEFLIIDEGSESLFGPDQVIFQGNPEAWTTVPDNEQFEFLGHHGDMVSILPQVEEEGIIFLGLATDELTEGTFVDNSVTLTLENSHGPGNFFLYTVDTFSTPSVLFDSRVDGPSSTALGVGLHSHMNWAFTEPGHYELEFIVSATLQDGGANVQSETITLIFNILPIPRTILSAGEVDIEVEFEDGNFELLIIDESSESEFGPNDVIFQGNPEAWTTVPDGDQFGFLGNAGDPISILPQVEEEGIIFLGLATDELTEGTFVDNSVTLTLEHMHGPGNFFLYNVDTFSVPNLLIASTEGGPDSTQIGVGLHTHLNWAFTQPGHYELEFIISGTLQDGGDEIVSEEITLEFDIKADSDALQVQIGLTADKGVTIAWQSMENTQYQVEFRSSIGSGDWTPFGDPIAATGEMIQISIESGDLAETGFFRIQQSASE